MSFLDKKQLELLLSKVPRAPRPRRELEQYETPADVASHVLWTAYMSGDVAGKDVVEPACGRGKFALGALALGASRVVCIDIDEDMVRSAADVCLSLLDPSACSRALFVVADAISLLLREHDTAIMNPPFGVVKGSRGLDLAMLSTYLAQAKSVYTLHKASEHFMEALLRKAAGIEAFVVERVEKLRFAIPMMFESHRRKVYRFDVLFLVLRRKDVGEKGLRYPGR
ncbi:MAG: DNA methylase [Desulfurococcaceae archaeon]